MDQNVGNRSKHESEWSGPWWKHPYMAYIFGVLVLFVFLVVMGYLALENDWIPQR